MKYFISHCLKTLVFITIALNLTLEIKAQKKWNETQKSTADPVTRKIRSSFGRSDWDYFGNVTAINGQYAFVAAKEDDEDSSGKPITNGGAVYVYKMISGQWTQTQKLTADNAHSDDQFGVSMASYGDLLVVGAPQEDYDISNSNFKSSAGSVYVFKNVSGKWIQIQKIVASDRDAGDNFGAAVGVSGNYIIAGAWGEDEDTSGSNTLASAGSAYVFRWSSGRWVQNCKLVPSSGRGATEFFGKSVAINDSFAIVGSYNHSKDASGANTLSAAGAVYIFKNISGTWSQFRKIVPSDRAAQDQFGISVSLNNNNLLIGSNKNSNAGAAYIFRYNGSTWVQFQKLVAKDRAVGDRFSSSLCIYGDYAILGASEESQDTSNLNTKINAGSAYIFKNIAGSWTQIRKVVAQDRTASDNFGIGVAIDSNYAFIGASGDDRDTFGSSISYSSGSAYIFKNVSGKWNQTRKIVASDWATNDLFGSSVDMDTAYAIVGAPQEDEDMNEANSKYNAGAAFIYKKVSGKWKRVQKLCASDRDTSDNFGFSVSIKGDYAIVGADKSNLDTSRSNKLDDAGAAYIFKNISGKWTEIQKITAPDRDALDQFGFSVAIHDSFAIVGSIMESLDANGANKVFYAGAAYIFKNVSGKWKQVQKVTASNRAVNDVFGYSVDINDKYAIVGSPYSSTDSSGANSLSLAGSVHIFRNQGNSWVKIQKLVPSDRKTFDYFGASVAISSDHIVVGSDRFSPGSAYIYRNISGYWVEITELFGNDKAINKGFGKSVAIDGDYVVAGAYMEPFDADGKDSLISGAAYIFKRITGNQWKQVQKIVSSDRAFLDYFGNSVSIKGDYILCGANYEDEDSSGNNSLSGAGSVYFFQSSNCDTFVTRIAAVSCAIYTSPSGRYDWSNTGIYNDTLTNIKGCDSIIQVSLKINNSDSFLHISACNIYASPSGKYKWSNSGLYNDTIPNSLGCDSLLRINLTVLKTTYDTSSATGCNLYVSPSGRQIWIQSGVYNDTLTNVAGCDSIITVDLTIRKSTNSAIDPKVCTVYNSPSNRYTWTASGTYKDTIPNAVGCDSVITIQLTVLKNTTFVVSPSVCYSYISPSKKYVWTQSGIYRDTIPSSIGCDSIISVNLTINQATGASLTVNTCNYYNSPSSKHMWTQSGVYMDTISNSAGCDSVLTIDLVVRQKSSSSVSVASCDKYASPSTRYTWSQSGVYHDTIQNTAGCDSLITINLTINVIDTTVIRHHDTLMANVSGATYQWLDCNDAYKPVTGATGQTFVPTADGEFAVKISKDGCADTSSCFYVKTLGVGDVISGTIRLYPNPTNGILHVSAFGTFEVTGIHIIDVTGKEVRQVSGYSQIDLSGLSNGVYLVIVKSGEVKQYFKVIKE